MSNELTGHEDKRHKLLFRIEQSIRYHTHRKRFFEAVHNWITFIVALSGTATFITVIGDMGQKAQLYAAFLVTVFSLVDLIIRSPEKARLYDDLSKRFIVLEKKIILSKELDTDMLTCIDAKILDIEADEPPPLRILNAICRNETLQAKGYDKEKHKTLYKEIGLWQYRLRNIWDLCPDKI